MPPVSADTFASDLRSLGRDDLLAFLADVWAARGWETTAEDGRVVAERGRERVTVALVRPGRLRTPALPDADVVVSTRADDRVATAAREAGVDYVDPEDLRDLLLYGLDREVAERLYESHVGSPLVDDPVPAQESEMDRGRDDQAAENGWRPSARVVVAVSLLVLAGGAAAGPALLGGFGAGSDAGDVETLATFQPGGTASPTEQNYPPGVNESGVASAVTLANAHLDAVRDRAYEFRVAASGPPDAPVMHGRTDFAWHVRVENGSRYAVNTTYTYPQSGTDRETVNSATYVDGKTVYRRVAEENGSVDYQRAELLAESPTDEFAESANRYVFTFLSTTESSVDCMVVEAGACKEYRVVANGEPQLFSRPVTEYLATARVRPSGLVTQLRATYTVTLDDGSRVTAQFQFAYTRLGGVEVAPPAWLDEAKNATADGETATVTGTPAGASPGE